MPNRIKYLRTPTLPKTPLGEDISGKVDKIEGKGLSTNDFTDEYKEKLDNTAGNTEMTILDILDAWNNV